MVHPRKAAYHIVIFPERAQGRCIPTAWVRPSPRIHFSSLDLGLSRIHILLVTASITSYELVVQHVGFLNLHGTIVENGRAKDSFAVLEEFLEQGPAGDDEGEMMIWWGFFIFEHDRFYDQNLSQSIPRCSAHTNHARMLCCGRLLGRINSARDICLAKGSNLWRILIDLLQHLCLHHNQAEYHYTMSSGPFVSQQVKRVLYWIACAPNKTFGIYGRLRNNDFTCSLTLW